MCVCIYIYNHPQVDGVDDYVPTLSDPNLLLKIAQVIYLGNSVLPRELLNVSQFIRGKRLGHIAAIPIYESLGMSRTSRTMRDLAGGFQPPTAASSHRIPRKGGFGCYGHSGVGAAQLQTVVEIPSWRIRCV